MTISREPIRQSNGRVAEMMYGLVPLMHAAGIDVSAENIGIGKDGKSDDLLGKKFGRALEQLVMIAQVESGVKPQDVTRDYNLKTIAMVENFLSRMEEQNLQRSGTNHTQRFMAGLHALRDDKGIDGTLISVFDQAYGGLKRQTSTAELEALIKARPVAEHIAAKAERPEQVQALTERFDAAQIEVPKEYVAQVAPKPAGLKDDHGTVVDVMRNLKELEALQKGTAAETPKGWLRNLLSF